MSSSLDTLKILVVEHTDPMCDLIATVLQTVNSRGIYKAHNAEHAIVLYQTMGHDLLMIDLDIEPKGGIELARKIREDDTFPQGKNVPIILTASYANLETIGQARLFGIDDILVKPFSFDDLENHIHHIMKHKKSGHKE